MNRRFFCGGFYGKGEQRKFGLVSPAGILSHPYVCDSPEEAQFDLFRFCKHHSNLYELVDRSAHLKLHGDWSAIDVGRADGCHASADLFVPLTDDQVNRILQAPIWSIRPKEKEMK